jgi:predicted GIY-YIG superfamily endonuclease
MLIRDRLLARIAAERGVPDYVRLAADVLGIRNAPPALARRLVEQALVIEDRREAWLETGERICARAPSGPGVYVLRDAEGRALYVGKANSLRRRLRTHFAARRWRAVSPEFSRTAAAEWHEVGSEIEALLLEAQLIGELAPVVNVQVAAPSLDTRAIPSALLRDTLLVLPSARADDAALIAVRPEGAVLMRTVGRHGTGLRTRVKELRQFFANAEGTRTAEDAGTPGLSPLVYSWLAGRGGGATRLDPHDAASARELERRIRLLLNDPDLFAERIVVIRSGFRSTSPRP